MILSASVLTVLPLSGSPAAVTAPPPPPPPPPFPLAELIPLLRN